MKRLLLFVTIVPISYFSYAQNCNETADARIKLIQEAALEEANQNARAYDSLRKEMSATFTILENCAAKNPSYESRSKIKKVLIYSAMASYAGLINKYPEMLKHIESMERILPNPGAIPVSAISSFSINGTNYTSDVSANYISTLYYQTIERRANYYYFAEFNYKKVIEWYEKTNGAPSDFKPAALEALLYADAMYKSGKTKAEYFPAMAKSISLLGAQWTKKEEHDSSMINNRSLALTWFKREMNVYNKPSLNATDPGGKWRMLSARGLWDIDDKPLAKEYALSASQGGVSNKEDGFWYLDMVSNNETEHVVGALNILERALPSLTESEMDRLLPLAQKHNVYGLEEGIKSRMRKIASLRRRSTISLIPSIELIGLPFGHIPVSLNLRTGRVMQEFRFDYVWGAKTKYRFGRAFAKGDKGERYQFTGWDAGYGLSVILGNDFKQGNRKKGRSAFYCPAIGLDFRYANWNFDPIRTNVLNDDGGTTESNVLINAKTNRYEICYRTSFVTVTRYVTIDYYLGLGIGYRTLTTEQGRNVEKEHFDDPRLHADRWNKLYMPLRMGLKIGLNVL